MNTTNQRIQLLRARLDSLGLDGLLISAEVNVGYLTGFTGEATTLLLTQDRMILISDGRFTTQLEQECPGGETYIRKIGEPMFEGVCDLVLDFGLRRLGLEAHKLTLEDFLTLEKATENLDLVPTTGLVETHRQVKDAHEIAEIREAVAIAERAFLDFRAWLKPGTTEKAAADFLEVALRTHGATCASFPTIVACGKRAALPHARPTPEHRLGTDDLILVDWGATGRPYKSDLTRVLVTGKVGPEFATIYSTVLEAQQRAIEAVRPGAIARTIDAAARSVIDKAGYGRFFNHSVGHGFGREVHEAPILRNVNEAELRPGMVITIEPGIYLPDWGGIRIEDDVLVTETGYEVLSSLPKSLESTQL
jgi:Xaa-Pro aminopeptidase